MRPWIVWTLTLPVVLGGCSDHAQLSLGIPNRDSAVNDAARDAEPALRLTGPDARITLDYTPELDLADHFTFEAWVWPFGPAEGEMLLCKSDQQREDKSVRLVGDSATPSVSLAMTAAPSPASLTPNVGLAMQRWHHLALSYGEGELQLFIGGTLVRRLSRTDPVADGTGTLYLGACLASDWLPPRDVALSDVRLSRVARYSANFSPEPRLVADGDAVALYRLDEAQAFTAGDAGPHALHASIGGSAEWVQLPTRSSQ